MNVTRSVLAAWLLAVVIPAQAGGAKPSANRVEYDKLVAEWTAATKANQEAMKVLMASDAYKQAVEAKDTAKINELRGTVVRPDAKAFGKRALALADQFAGEEAMPFLVYAGSNFADADTAKGVAERVLKDHIKSPALGDLMENAMTLTRFVGPETSAQLLDRVVAESPHKLPKAWAMYWQAVTIQRNKEASAEDKAKAEQLLVDAEALAAGTGLAERLAAPRFEKEKLQIGMEVPDIVGEDVDGVAFKLSDYRGKVVVLDYWGFW